MFEPADEAAGWSRAIAVYSQAGHTLRGLTCTMESFDPSSIRSWDGSRCPNAAGR